MDKMKHKEKKFTKRQLKAIERIRKAIDYLRSNNVCVEGRQYNLTFWREENYNMAADFDCSGKGDLIPKETIRIDDSGADDEFYYKPNVEIIK